MRFHVPGFRALQVQTRCEVAAFPCADGMAIGPCLQDYGHDDDKFGDATSSMLDLMDCRGYAGESATAPCAG